MKIIWRKFKLFIEKLKLSADKYDLMKYNVNLSERIKSCINVENNVEFESIYDKVGMQVDSLLKSKTTIVNVDARRILFELGVVFNESVEFRLVRSIQNNF